MKKVIIFGGVLGVAIATLMMFIGASHNPQGEFTNDPLYLLAVGLNWASPYLVSNRFNGFRHSIFCKEADRKKLTHADKHPTESDASFSVSWTGDLDRHPSPFVYKSIAFNSAPRARDKLLLSFLF